MIERTENQERARKKTPFHGWTAVTISLKCRIREDVRRDLVEQIGMAAGAVKDKMFFISCIDQEPVRFDVTFSVILPFT